MSQYEPLLPDDEVATDCPECHDIAVVKDAYGGSQNPYRVLYYACRTCGFTWARCPHCQGIAREDPSYRMVLRAAPGGLTVLTRWRCSAHVSHWWSAEDENVTPQDLFGDATSQ